MKTKHDMFETDFLYGNFVHEDNVNNLNVTLGISNQVSNTESIKMAKGMNQVENLIMQGGRDGTYQDVSSLRKHDKTKK